MTKKKKKKDTIGTVATAVTETVKTAAKATAKAAEEYVVAPVGKVLGMTLGRKPKVKKARYVRPARTLAAKEKPTGAARKATSAGKMMARTVAKSLPKPGAKEPAKKGPGPK